MMMYAVAEEHSFGIYGKILEILAVPVPVIVFENALENFPYRKVVLAVLIPQDIPAVFSRLSQMVDVFFLLKCQFIPPGYLITHYLQIRELVDKIPEILVLLLTGRVSARNSGGSQCCNSRHSDKIFHNIHKSS